MNIYCHILYIELSWAYAIIVVSSSVCDVLILRQDQLRDATSDAINLNNIYIADVTYQE